MTHASTFFHGDISAPLTLSVVHLTHLYSESVNKLLSITDNSEGW